MIVRVCGGVGTGGDIHGREWRGGRGKIERGGVGVRGVLWS